MALMGLAHEWAAQNPAECAVWIAKRNETSDDAETPAESLASEWAQYDPQASAAWVATLPDGDTRTLAALRTATTWVTADPAAASAWVDGLQNIGMRNELAHDIAATWASIDPQAALAWAQGQPETKIKHETTEEVFDSWAHVEGAGLESWLATQPAGEITDAACKNWLMPVLPISAHPVLATAGKISDEQTRAGRMVSLYAFWLQKNAPAARQWLRDTPVSDSPPQA